MKGIGEIALLMHKHRQKLAGKSPQKGRSARRYPYETTPVSLTSQILFTSEVHMESISKEAQNLFSQYLTCWNNRDLEGVAACFDEPAMFILPAGAVALPDRAALVALLEKVFEGLEQAGFSHTTIGAVQAQLCGDGIAIVDAKDVNRLKHDGSLLEAIDGHYVARKTGDGWRFTVAVACSNGWQTR